MARGPRYCLTVRQGSVLAPGWRTGPEYMGVTVCRARHVGGRLQGGQEIPLFPSLFFWVALRKRDLLQRAWPPPSSCPVVFSKPPRLPYCSAAHLAVDVGVSAGSSSAPQSRPPAAHSLPRCAGSRALWAHSPSTPHWRHTLHPIISVLPCGSGASKRCGHLHCHPSPQVSGPDDGCLLSSFLRGRVPLLLAWHLDPRLAVSGWKEQRPLLAGGCQRRDPSCTRAGQRQRAAPRQPQGQAGWTPTASRCCCFEGGFRCLLFTGRGPLRREGRGREAVSRRCPRTAGLATA